MDKRRGRISGKASLSFGHRLKLVIALTLAVTAAGHIAFDSANSWPGDLVGKNSASDCNAIHYIDADGASACTLDAAGTNVQEAPNSPGLDASTLYSANGIRGEANESRQRRRANTSRAWYDQESNSHGPRAGYTMAELCIAGLDDKDYRCWTGRDDERFNVPESGAAAGSISRHTISGHVLTADGVGLNGVTIVASPVRLNGKQITDAETLHFWTATDSLGAYSLDGLPNGEYTIRSNSHGPYRSARISARAGVNYADLLVSRNSVTAVEGLVLTASGEPLEGVTVLPILLGQPSVLTGDDGHFRLPVTLKPTVNSFALRFQRPGYVEKTSEVKLRGPGALRDAAVNVVMHPVESWTSLSGTVQDDSGEPLAGRVVELKLSSAQRAYSATTDHQGKYTFPFVESPAAYRLIVFGGTAHKDYQQALNLTADTSELDVVVESYEFGEVTGQLVNLNGVPVPDFDLVLRHVGSRKPNALVSTDKHGNFAIPAAPAGEFVVASQSTPSILVQGLHLRPGDKLYLPLVLDWGEHEIRGIVVDSRGHPVPASRIVMQWFHQAGGVTTTATRRTAADTQGHFVFSNLGPGSHSLRINAPGFSQVDIDHDLSRQGYDLTVRLN